MFEESFNNSNKEGLGSEGESAKPYENIHVLLCKERIFLRIITAGRQIISFFLKEISFAKEELRKSQVWTVVSQGYVTILYFPLNLR
ncbi:hypothetical protein TH61_03810 [Rufibacter sp. DG15C]|uniref:hypothetical protein n=1 Tax=Rufibacter sp. DG15C TaxID=1379909 RepID=UPI00078BFED7|nr:hypothetical protein [Rufibacter sp. DG15C]AMM50487.1 hypothetical protein TH61_03810 [Rufibacter sp. DG15C]